MFNIVKHHDGYCYCCRYHYHSFCLLFLSLSFKFEEEESHFVFCEGPSSVCAVRRLILDLATTRHFELGELEVCERIAYDA